MSHEQGQPKPAGEPGQSEPPGRPARPRLDSALPPNVRLTQLGELLENARIATGELLDAFLRARKLSIHTWHRLIYGLTSANGSSPAAKTVRRYARAAGVDEEEALRLAKEVFGTDAGRSLTPLGQELEKYRQRSGETTRSFLDKRGLTPSTWYRLLHGGIHRVKRDTVAKYAEAVGMDVERALRMYAQDSVPSYVNSARTSEA